MVTCRPEILFPLTTISQYSAAPTSLHNKAVHDIYDYLKTTLDEDIDYWSQMLWEDLKEEQIPKYPQTHNYKPQARKQSNPTEVRATVDLDYTGDTIHRRSVMDICIKIARGWRRGGIL